MKIAIADITIGKRHRKDMGDLDSLKDSMVELGLLQPIGVTDDNALVFGERRLCAAADLGWTEMDAVRINLDDPMKAEFDENDCRKSFTISERVAICKSIEEREKERAKERQKEAGKTHGRGKIASLNLSEAIETGKAKAIAAKAVGMSENTLTKAQEVVQYVEEHPMLEHVLEEMDRTGKVAPAHRAITAAQNPAAEGGETDADAQQRRLAMDKAYAATNLLKRIQVNNPFRDAAFQHVRDFVKRR